ncbi:UDP-N-acetylglucosamine transporter-like, partial [Penaeus indicus]|uniref:UDP-N-acetylglucosamine transporter-like n=1 Tax=Penaeus indicus TaxID=29960 RepID=UPI00300D0024
MGGLMRTTAWDDQASGGWLKKHLFSIKTLSLIVLSVQTSTMVLLLRYSRTPTTSNQTPYIITTAVLLSEILKLGLSLGFLHIEAGKVLRVTLHRLYRDVLMNVWETFKLAVPACLYVVQNNLLFIALSNLDAATYQLFCVRCEFVFVFLNEHMKFYDEYIV